MFSRLFIFLVGFLTFLCDRAHCAVDPIAVADLFSKISALALSPDVLDAAAKVATSSINDGILNAGSLLSSAVEDINLDPQQLTSAFSGLSSTFVGIGEVLSKV
jgi:hypothetical protein